MSDTCGHIRSPSDVTLSVFVPYFQGLTGHKKHTHSSEHTHTVNTHPEQWAAIYAAVPGEQLEVRCLAQKGTSVVVLRVERALYIHSPHLQFLPARDSNSQPLDYESDSLTIRLRLPPIYIYRCIFSKCNKMFSLYL